MGRLLYLRPMSWLHKSMEVIDQEKYIPKFDLVRNIYYNIYGKLRQITLERRSTRKTMLSDEDYSKMLKKPIKDMTIGDVVEYFDIIRLRKHGGDEDVKRTASELKARFIMEALYKSDEFPSHKELQENLDKAVPKVMIDSGNVSLSSSHETVQSQNYLDSNCRLLPPNLLRDRQRAKELKNLVREFCEDRDAGRLVHPNNASIFFDRANGKTRLTISSVSNNKLFVQVIINGLTRYFYVNVKFNRTPLPYNWWKVYSRRITKKLGKIINILEKGEYNE